MNLAWVRVFRGECGISSNPKLVDRKRSDRSTAPLLNLLGVRSAADSDLDRERNYLTDYLYNSVDNRNANKPGMSAMAKATKT
jgi:hypothetical protein